MKRSITEPFSALSRRATVVVTAAVLAACALGIASPAGANSTPNPCHVMGITKAVGRSIFPKLGGVVGGPTEQQTTPPNFGNCAVEPDVAGGTSLEAELWARAVFTEQVATFKQNGKVQHLTHLGKGAVYEPVKGLPSDGNLLFQRGKYTVLITPSTTGGSNKLYPTEKLYVRLANAIFRHLG